MYSNPDTAIILSTQALRISNSLPNGEGRGGAFTANSLRNLGVFNWLKGNYPQALDYYFKALKMAEDLGDKQLEAKTLGNIGIVYKDQGDYPKADRKSTRLNSSHIQKSRMPSSA